ncbi:glycosyltransferase [Modestobacter sp. VKM Ac-2985]|uniref:glycosyltransferase n=1 Tax=Modestobacter sp. VKM Ac-2985 TaxID=3004139 RepID=UPI0022AB7E0A|nr:glycosyltransferase [Modestobacter sp. VKM Ac-2985]MCZ2836037.1 glycosyltransferase [Modestobacter sp. VKM Ac-2985]
MDDSKLDLHSLLQAGGPVLALASGGGHLAELQQLTDGVVSSSALVWCTSGQPREPDTVLFPYIPAKSLSRVARAVPLARRIIREHGVVRVITTGAAIALPFAAACKIEGIPLQYVESAARQDRLSVTGRLLRASRLAAVAAQFDMGPGIPIATNIFDGFERLPAASSAHERPLRRVVVTFGTSSDWMFRTAIKRVDEVLSPLVEDDADVLCQTGEDGERMIGRSTHRLVPASALHHAIMEADLVIGHAGVGTALMAMQAGKLPLLLPRRASRGEHTDDHQVQLAAYLESRGLAVTCEAEELSTEHIRAATSERVGRVGHHGSPAP